MKLDICEKIIRQGELCSEVKYCCKMMESMVEQNHININVFEFGPDVRLYVDDTRDYIKYYRKKDKDIIDIHYAVNINYCPFCGERIEQTEKRSSPI